MPCPPCRSSYKICSFGSSRSVGSWLPDCHRPRPEKICAEGERSGRSRLRAHRIQAGLPLPVTPRRRRRARTTTTAGRTTTTTSGRTTTTTAGRTTTTAGGGRTTTTTSRTTTSTGPGGRTSSTTVSRTTTDRRTRCRRAIIWWRVLTGRRRGCAPMGDRPSFTIPHAG